MRILLNLSGGVDSAAAAILLSEAGHDVVCVTMDIRQKSGTYPKSGSCFGEKASADTAMAAKVCGLLGLEHHVIDLSEEFERVVLRGFCSEYAAGRTPNPCVVCNAALKFAALPAAAEKIAGKFDAIATGHYARIENRENRFCLRRAADLRKDQSYFLYRLPQSVLKRVIFPLGDMTKAKAREIVFSHGLELAGRSESQDFYSGDRNELPGFKPVAGNIVDLSGKVIGRHTGCWKFVPGQRKGIGVAAAEPLFVIEIRPAQNEVVVGPSHEAVQTALIMENAIWVSLPETVSEFEAALKVRSSGEPLSGARVCAAGAGRFHVSFPAGIRGVAPGQSAVLYDSSGFVLMGGIISEAWK